MVIVVQLNMPEARMRQMRLYVAGLCEACVKLCKIKLTKNAKIIKCTTYQGVSTLEPKDPQNIEDLGRFQKRAKKRIYKSIRK